VYSCIFFVFTSLFFQKKYQVNCLVLTPKHIFKSKYRQKKMLKTASLVSLND